MWLALILFMQAQTTDTIKVTYYNLTEIAQKYSPTIKEITFNSQSAKTNLTGSILNFLGSAEFNLQRVDVTYQNPPNPYTSLPPYSSYLRLKTALPSTNNFLGTLSSYFEGKTSILANEDAKNQFLLNLRTQYLNVVKLKKLQEAYEKALERARIYYQLTMQRYQMGMASKIDSLKAEIELKNAEINLLNAQNNYKKQLELLLSALGLLSDKYTVLIEDFDAPLPTNFTVDLNKLLEIQIKNNTSIRNAKSLLNSARINIFYTAFTVLPQISFERTWNYSGNSIPRDLSPYTEKEQWNAQIYFNLINYPISFITRAQMERAYSYRFKKVLYDNMAKLKNAFEDFQYNLKTVELADLRYKQAYSAYELAREQYREGLISIIQLMDTEASLLQSEVGLIEAKYNLIIAKENLNYLVGTEVIK